MSGRILRGKPEGGGERSLRSNPGIEVKVVPEEEKRYNEFVTGVFYVKVLKEGNLK